MRTMGSLFSGIGGWEFAARGVMEPLWAVELEPKVAEAYEANHGDHVIISDLRKVDPRRLAPVDVLVASPPRPDFSKALKDTSKPRDPEIAKLGLDIVRYVKVLQPECVCVENAPEYLDSDVGGELMDRLRILGYAVQGARLRASDYGCPQIRERTIIRAVRHPLPGVEIGNTVPSLPEKTFLSWDAALEDLLPELDRAELAGWQADNIKHVPPTSYPVFVSGGSPPAFKNETGHRRVWTSHGMPCPTVARAKSSSGAKIMLGKNDVRQVSIDAFAALSGFLDPGVLVLPKGSRTDSINLLGNTIPLQLAAAALHGMMG